MRYLKGTEYFVYIIPMWKWTKTGILEIIFFCYLFKSTSLCFLLLSVSYELSSVMCYFLQYAGPKLWMPWETNWNKMMRSHGKVFLGVRCLERNGLCTVYCDIFLDYSTLPLVKASFLFLDLAELYNVYLLARISMIRPHTPMIDLQLGSEFIHLWLQRS